MASPLPDLQASIDERGLPLDEAGVVGLRCPIEVAGPGVGRQQTVARVTASVRVPAEAKGAHLSRFVESLGTGLVDVSLTTIDSVLRELALRMESDQACLRLDFPYFVSRSAPASGRTALLDVDCQLTARLRGDRVSVELSATTPVTTLCPGSKAISDYGAHNQRTYVTVVVYLVWDEKLKCFKGPWFDELIEAAEKCSSSPIYPVLKRPDERIVTMHAYDHPGFVEDVVRNLALRLRDDSRIRGFKIEARSVESIHSHDAFARIRWDRDVSDSR